MPLGSSWEGEADTRKGGGAIRRAMTREPGNLPDAVDPSCGRGVPRDRGLSSRDDAIGPYARAIRQRKRALIGASALLLFKGGLCALFNCFC